MPLDIMTLGSIFPCVLSVLDVTLVNRLIDSFELKYTFCPTERIFKGEVPKCEECGEVVKPGKILMSLIITEESTIIEKHLKLDIFTKCFIILS